LNSKALFKLGYGVYIVTSKKGINLTDRLPTLYFKSLPIRQHWL